VRGGRRRRGIDRALSYDDTADHNHSILCYVYLVRDRTLSQL
jgi:hypothetical protein